MQAGTSMGIADFIGGRGEAIAHKQFSQFCRIEPDLPFFVPHHLGEKCRTFDYLVELVDTDETPLFFFVQVKTTRKALTKTQNPPRLRVEVSEKDIRQMVACPLPTYVVGVQEIEERAFIIAVHGEMSKAIPSITTAHELNPDTLRRLWDEVREFWRDRNLAQTTSFFVN
jgi:hypothetical protein